MTVRMLAETWCDGESAACRMWVEGASGSSKAGALRNAIAHGWVRLRRPGPDGRIVPVDLCPGCQRAESRQPSSLTGEHPEPED